MKGGYFLRNGRFNREDEAVFSLEELSQRTDGFSEYFRAEHNEILFAEAVCSHLHAAATSIGVDLTELLKFDGRLLRRDVSRLLNKNKLYQAAKIHIQIYPAMGQNQILLSAQEIEKGYYPISEPGLILSFFRDYLVEDNASTPFLEAGFFVRKAALRRARELNQSEMILLNGEGCACQTIHGSFAYLEEGTLFFTSNRPGAYNCAIRETIMLCAKESGFTPQVKETITTEELLQAEELFLYDDCNGIRKVLGLEDERYYSTKTQLIATRLSEKAREDREERG